MNSGKLPPQAFTSHEVTNAMRWLDKQPRHIKTMADTTDSLMALYRQAMLYGNEFYEKYPAVSEQKFRQDLHQIAGQLSSFVEKKPMNPPAPQKPISFAEEVSTNKDREDLEPLKPIKQEYVEKEKLQFSLERERREERNVRISDLLDPASNQKLSEVRQRLNLSSETEVARMLISLGYEKLKNL